MYDMEGLLHIMADMQHFAGYGDKLEKLTSQDDELSLEELHMVAAAGATPSFEQFQKLLDGRNRR